MAEVKLKFAADVRELQKGAAQAEKALQEVAREAKAVGGASSGLARNADSAGRALASVNQSSGAARNALTDLNRVVSDAPFGFVAIQNNIDQLGASFASLVRQSGGARGAFKALAASFAGPAGILTLLSLASSAFVVFGDDIVNAFRRGAKAAADAQAAFKDAIDEVLNFDDLNRDTVLALAQDQRRQVERAAAALEEARGNLAQRVGRGAGALLGSDALQQQQSVIAALKQRLAEEQELLTRYEAQVRALDQQGRIQAKLRLQGVETTEAETAAVLELTRAETDLAKLRAQAFAAVGTNAPISGFGQGDAAAGAGGFGPLPAAPEKVYDESAVQNFLSLQQQVNAQLAQGRDLFTEVGAQAAAALASVAVGFDKVENITDRLRDVVRGLVADLIVAGARAAALSLLFPGAAASGGGIGGLFKRFLGIPALASGGIVNRPTLSLIGEAGPEAVVPLSKLQTMGGTQRVEVVPSYTRLPGGDLLLTIRDAQQTSGRTIGNINLAG